MAFADEAEPDDQALASRFESAIGSAFMDLSRTRSSVSMLASLVLLCVTAPVSAQGQEGRGDHGHDHHGLDSPSHGHAVEIGLAPGLAYLPDDSEFAFGLHLHVVAAIEETPWGLGIGVERLFDPHGHTTFSLVVQRRIVAGWSLIVAPGATLEDSDWTTPLPSVHIETTYEFTLGAFHIGPSLEVSIDPGETHISLGIHVAIGL